MITIDIIAGGTIYAVRHINKNISLYYILLYYHNQALIMIYVPETVGWFGIVTVESAEREMIGLGRGRRRRCCVPWTAGQHQSGIDRESPIRSLQLELLLVELLLLFLMVLLLLLHLQLQLELLLQMELMLLLNVQMLLLLLDVAVMVKLSGRGRWENWQERVVLGDGRRREYVPISGSFGVHPMQWRQVFGGNHG